MKRGLILSGVFVGLWTAVLIRTALGHGAWVPWAIGLALCAAVLAEQVVRYRECRRLGADAERTDERLSFIRARAGEMAFFAQSLLILTASLWAFAAGGAGASLAGDLLTYILLLGLAAHMAAYLLASLPGVRARARLRLHSAPRKREKGGAGQETPGKRE